MAAYRRFPEPNGFEHPSVGTGAEPKAMTDALVLVVFHIGAGLAEGRDPPFHDGRRGKLVFLTHNHERGRIGGRIVGVLASRSWQTAVDKWRTTPRVRRKLPHAIALSCFNTPILPAMLTELRQVAEHSMHLWHASRPCPAPIIASVLAACA